MVGSWSLRLRGTLMLVRRSRRGRDEHVVMAVVAPIEVGAGGPVPNLNRSVVWSVDDNGVSVASSEHVCMLFVSPFAVRT